MKSSASAIAEALNEFAKTLRETELPNDADTTARILQTQTCERVAIKEDIKIAMRKCTALLRAVRQNEIKPSAAQLSPTRLHNVSSIERMLIQLDETEKSFDSFWGKHERRLTNCLQLRQFEDLFRKLQASFARHMLYLEEHRGVGDGVAQATQLAQAHAQYTATAMEDVQAAKELKKKGDELRTANEDEHSDSVLPKCDELERMADALTSALERRTQVLRISCTMHDEIRRANVWCSRGVDLLTSLPAVETPSAARTSLTKLDSFLHESNDIRLDSWTNANPAENFVLLTTTETSTLITQVAERMNDILRISAARRDAIARAEEARSRNPPVQVVTPEKKPREREDRSKREKVVKKMEEEDETLRIEDDNTTDETDDSSSSPPEISNERAIDCCDAMESGSLPVEPTSSKSLQSCVINELITTERTYVSELESIVEFYVKPFKLAESQAQLGPEIKGRAHLLFGNLGDLLDFHSQCFLPHLANQPSPSHICKAFVAHKDRFLHLYHHYCQNKSTSEAIRKEFGDGTPFFMECQRRAGHLLPLGAYLLKPVQRITKYQLLLRELERHCSPEVRSDVMCALSTMLELLAQINSNINQLHITGFNGDLRLLGPLRLQSDCNIYAYNRRKKGSRLGRAQRRYALLFDGGLLFCKKKSALTSPSAVESEHFEYKLFIPTNLLAFCESSRFGFERFDVWDTLKVEAYVVEIFDFSIRSRWLERLGHSLTCDAPSLIGGEGIGIDSKRRPKSWSSTVSNESSASSTHTSDSIDSHMDSNGNTHCSPLNSARFPPSISSPANIALEIDTSPNQYVNFDETEELIDSV
ncbi:hypothetical protein WR25_16353 isoform C [Diploscapter pachys]|nr:hypothetical protein WR25_16353 isoform C [Diploscapter pachys]